MNVQQVIDFARATELKNLSAQNYDDTTIIAYINLGMMELHRRFNVRVGVEVIQTVSTIPVYNMRNADIIQILSVHNALDELLAPQAYIGDEDYDIKYINYNTILLNKAKDEELVIVYKASSLFIAELTDEVGVPPVLIEALLSYIGYKAHGAKDPGAENSPYFNKFNAVCAGIIRDGFGTDDAIPGQSTQMKGFV